MLTRLQALVLLAECTGRDIWSLGHCRHRGVPEAWIAELHDAFESGFQHDRQTIYDDGRVVNQYAGVHDLELAKKLAAFLGIDVERATSTALTAEAQVQALREAVDE